ncbi:hypothetical protein NPIL_373571 [Nephila pilipes]|uniref:Uncharacterized protein n=1 Tax=Nephila pilipes TaxID=299642 RepID=A0A8X6QYJ5_NEPPI|nr:hypothetical protein NPIL_373571 [Nephila pilipes]
MARVRIQPHHQLVSVIKHQYGRCNSDRCSHFQPLARYFKRRFLHALATIQGTTKQPASDHRANSEAFQPTQGMPY